ncbi:MAG: hypothetical protein QOK37_2131 [Thermoanaerobaculia bacterium]|jgi:hypothetical protein|nr:hypothetical protein [Thermoanaerobaculia bacterium]
MSRITLNIDESVLDGLKSLRKNEGKSLGDLASELLADAIAERKRAKPSPVRLEWKARPMGAGIDLDDKEALFAALDREMRTLIS